MEGKFGFLGHHAAVGSPAIPSQLQAAAGAPPTQASASSVPPPGPEFCGRAGFPNCPGLPQAHPSRIPGNPQPGHSFTVENPISSCPTLPQPPAALVQELWKHNTLILLLGQVLFFTLWWGQGRYGILYLLFLLSYALGLSPAV